MCAPRASASSADSSTSTPAASPITKPSRRASNGLDSPDGEVASIAAKAAFASGVSVASAPPVTTASASPAWIIRSAAPIACVPEAQADITPNTGPRRPWRIASSPDAALPMISGIESGDTRSGPRTRSTSQEFSNDPMPPIPVPITQPIRSDSQGGSFSSHPASAIASAQAAIASCAKRSLRRASLVVITCLGSKSRHAPRPSSIPDRRASQPSCSVRAPMPSGVTAPTPVMTTRRLTTSPTRRRSRPR